MLLSRNPPIEGIRNIIAASKQKAAKWIKDNKTGDVWYWPAEEATHHDLAVTMGIEDYDKGISIPTEQ